MLAKHYNNFNNMEKNMTKQEVANAGERLHAAADTYKQRNKQYGNSYKMHGKIMDALFPDGVEIASVEDHNRFAIINTIASKLNRYCNNFRFGGHQDSIHDLGVYSFMLEELDEEYQSHYPEIEGSEYSD